MKVIFLSHAFSSKQYDTGDTLKHISELKETVFDFHFTPEQQEQISQLFRESLLYECDTIFEADKLGAFKFDWKQCSLETVI